MSANDRFLKICRREFQSLGSNFEKALKPNFSFFIICLSRHPLTSACRKLDVTVKRNWWMTCSPKVSHRLWSNALKHSPKCFANIYIIKTSKQGGVFQFSPFRLTCSVTSLYLHHGEADFRNQNDCSVQRVRIYNPTFTSASPSVMCCIVCCCTRGLQKLFCFVVHYILTGGNRIRETLLSMWLCPSITVWLWLVWVEWDSESVDYALRVSLSLSLSPPPPPPLSLWVI